MINKDLKYDLAVIGGGPAGMMAAGRAAEAGARVILLEKNASLGVKLLLTGKERCNLTNVSEDLRGLTKRFGVNGKFLFSTLADFGPKETIDFFACRGLHTKIEENGRVFPISDKAQDVLAILKDYLAEGHVAIRTNTAIKTVSVKNFQIKKLILSGDEKLVAENYLIATGGQSYPGTGSAGDAYAWLKKLGHTIIVPRPALAPLVSKENYCNELEGLSMKNINVSCIKNKKKILEQCGSAVFTADGLSGPLILDISGNVNREWPGDLALIIDFCPEYSAKELDERLQGLFHDYANRQLKNVLAQILQPKLASVVLKLSGVDPEKQANAVTRKERSALIEAQKKFHLVLRQASNFDKAMLTAGGASLNEIDPNTLRSKLISNLFLAGEILDLNGPSGGFNLQMCWSTGYAVGKSFFQ